jgi:xanthine dehydrogenase iron-sulfur cluster and FAD-binding subunit A
MLNFPAFDFREMGSVSKNILFSTSECGVCTPDVKIMKFTTLEQTTNTQRGNICVALLSL